MRSINTDGDWPALARWVAATIEPLRAEGHEVETFYVTGGAAGPAGPLLERMAQVVPLPESVNGVDGSEWPGWSALAGGALSASEFPRFNLLGPHPAHGKFARTIRTLSVGAGILLVLGTADLYVRYATAARTVAALKAESRRVFSSAMPHVKNVVNEDAQLKVALTTERQTREALLGTSAPSYLATTHGLGRLVVDHPELKVSEAILEGGRVAIAGNGRGITTEGLKTSFAGIAGAQGAQVEEIVQGVEANTYRFRVRVPAK